MVFMGLHKVHVELRFNARNMGVDGAGWVRGPWTGIVLPAARGAKTSPAITVGISCTVVTQVVHDLGSCLR